MTPSLHLRVGRTASLHEIDREPSPFGNAGSRCCVAMKLNLLARSPLGLLPVLVAGLTLSAPPASAVTPPADPPFTLRPLGTYATGVFDEGAAEIAVHDPATQMLYGIDNGGGVPKIDVISIADPTQPTLVRTIDVSPYGAVVNSVAVRAGVRLSQRETGTVVAAAVQPADKVQPGAVVFFAASDGSFLNQVRVGALPDMLSFTPDGKRILVANEGEPNDDYTIDPEGSVSVINLRRGVKRLKNDNVRTARFDVFNAGRTRSRQLDPRIRIFGPGASVAQDLEPEYITVSPDSKTAWVTLQENNALARVKIQSARVERLIALGTKDHSLPGNELDASNRDAAINIASWPVNGMYMPDGISTLQVGGETYLVTANEGDARDYDGCAEEEQVRNLTLDPDAFPNAAELQAQPALGRLNVTLANGDTDGDGDYDELFSFGARSFSIWSADGELVYDSGADFERITAAVFPADFNSTDTENDSFDDRSDNKGPEPEGLDVGEIDGRTYVFVGLERIGGVMVYDVTDPTAPSFVHYVNNRDFSGDPEAGTAGDLAPEGILFIPAADSPTGKPLVVTSNEVSGTVTVLEAHDPDGTPTLLHDNDGESALLPLQSPVTTPSGPVALDVGGIAVDYLLGLAAAGTPALPTIPADDPRYALGGEGRITVLPAS
jgi:DNA-binding beta-propeller fold protein YncE